MWQRKKNSNGNETRLVYASSSIQLLIRLNSFPDLDKRRKMYTKTEKQWLKRWIPRHGLLYITIHITTCCYWWAAIIMLPLLCGFRYLLRRTNTINGCAQHKIDWMKNNTVFESEENVQKRQCRENTKSGWYNTVRRSIAPVWMCTCLWLWIHRSHAHANVCVLYAKTR